MKPDTVITCKSFSILASTVRFIARATAPGEKEIIQIMDSNGHVLDLSYPAKDKHEADTDFETIKAQWKEWLAPEPASAPAKPVDGIDRKQFEFLKGSLKRRMGWTQKLLDSDPERDPTKNLLFVRTCEAEIDALGFALKVAEQCEKGELSEP